MTQKIKAIKSNDPHDWANFKRMRNKVNTEIKAAKKIRFEFRPTDSGQVLKLLNKLSKSKGAGLD